MTRWMCLFLAGCTGTLSGGALDAEVDDAHDAVFDAALARALIDVGPATADVAVALPVDRGVSPLRDAAPDDAAPEDAAPEDAAPDAAPAVDLGPPDAAPPLGGCPAEAPVHLEPPDWTAPDQDDAQRRIRLARGPGQFARALIEFDVRTTRPHGSWTQLVELRIVNGGRAAPIPTRYGAYTFQNNRDGATGERTGWRSKAVLTVWDECSVFTQTKPDFQVAANTDYHVRFEVDAVAGITTVTLDTPDGPVVAEGVAASSLVPSLGNELELVFGILTRHGDFERGMRPPWGWTISNLVIDLEPGGPFGPGAPDCEGRARARCP